MRHLTGAVWAKLKPRTDAFRMMEAPRISSLAWWRRRVKLSFTVHFDCCHPKKRSDGRRPMPTHNCRFAGRSGHHDRTDQRPLLGVKRTFDRRATQVCLTTTIDTIVGQSIERRLVPVRSGLAPSRRSKPLKELKLTTFNARAENEQTSLGDIAGGLTLSCVF